MSYIDCFDHEYIGSLGYLPIYRPLQVIDGEGWGGYDFSASPKNLVLGGGSGEHPGLIVHKPESLAAKFLYFHIDDEQEANISKENIDYVTGLCYEGDVLEFCGWSIRQYIALAEMAKSTAFTRPLKEGEDVEDWLCRSVGELVYFSLHELNPEYEKLSSIFDPLNIYASMQNVSCSPPGYPARGGRVTENGRGGWGVHRWKWMN